jgi:hypothetical protein
MSWSAAQAGYHDCEPLTPDRCSRRGRGNSPARRQRLSWSLLGGVAPARSTAASIAV